MPACLCRETNKGRRWLELHTACAAPGVPSQALLRRMLSTINSYFGLLCHANTHRLRQHIYHEELKGLRQYFSEHRLVLGRNGRVGR